jgi:hypothetical protein
VKKYYWNDGNHKYDFPSLLDLTFGQNEYVTGGSMRGFVVHVGGSTPIAHFPGVYLSGSADLVVARSQNGPNFLLQSAPSTVTINDASVAQLYVQQPNRDRYRVGIGLDIITVLSKLHNSSDSSSKTGASN